MKAPPFHTIRVRTNKDALRVRQRARQIAQLLNFPPHEQACIAAGTFLIACQGLQRGQSTELLFRIERGHLQIDADPPTASPLRLDKPISPDPGLATSDLGWLVKQLDSVAGGLFEEVVKQNNDVLELLHELRSGGKVETRTESGQSQEAA